MCVYEGVYCVCACMSVFESVTVYVFVYNKYKVEARGSNPCGEIIFQKHDTTINYECPPGPIYLHLVWHNSISHRSIL